MKSKLEYMGKNDMTVSIVYGPCGNNGVCYSVDVFNGKSGECFKKPFLVKSIDQAIEVAYLECVKRNWIDELGIIGIELKESISIFLNQKFQNN